MTEILYALGLQDQIVCTDRFSNFPSGAKDLPKLPDHAKIDPRDLADFSPEIVFTQTVIQEKLAVELRNAGFSVVHQDPRSIVGVYDSIRSLGALFDKDTAAEALIREMQHGLKDVKRKAALLPRRCRLYVEEWHDPPMASGNWVPELCHIAGAEQAIINGGELSREIRLSDVAAFDPDLIVISWCGAGLHADSSLLLNRPGWQNLPAVARGDIRVIDDSLLNRPGPRLVGGAQRLYGWLFEYLH